MKLKHLYQNKKILTIVVAFSLITIGASPSYALTVNDVSNTISDVSKVIKDVKKAWSTLKSWLSNPEYILDIAAGIGEYDDYFGSADYAQEVASSIEDSGDGGVLYLDKLNDIDISPQAFLRDGSTDARYTITEAYAEAAMSAFAFSEKAKEDLEANSHATISAAFESQDANNRAQAAVTTQDVAKNISIEVNDLTQIASLMNGSLTKQVTLGSHSLEQLLEINENLQSIEEQQANTASNTYVLARELLAHSQCIDETRRCDPD